MISVDRSVAGPVIKAYGRLEFEDVLDLQDWQAAVDRKLCVHMRVCNILDTSRVTFGPLVLLQ